MTESGLERVLVVEVVRFAAVGVRHGSLNSVDDANVVVGVMSLFDLTNELCA